MRKLDKREIQWLLDFAREYVDWADEMAQPSYGVFHGGDPNNFTPDPERSTGAERETHRLACEAWNQGETPEIPGCEWLVNGKAQIHLMRAPFGLGTNHNGEEQERCYHIKMLLKELGLRNTAARREG
jgi:hypothetical protein